MPRHWPEAVRAEALALLASNSQDYDATAKASGVPAATLRSWVARYGLPSPESSDRDTTVEDQDARAPVSRPPGQDAPLLVRSLVDMSRQDYLRHTVDRLDRVVVELMSEERPSGSSIRQVLSLQSDMHREYIEVVRAEGARLDLSADATAIARALEEEAALLRLLMVELPPVDDA